MVLSQLVNLFLKCTNNFFRKSQDSYFELSKQRNLVVSNKFESLLSLGKGSVKCLYQGGFIPYRGITELLEASRNTDLKGINFIFMEMEESPKLAKI